MAENFIEKWDQLSEADRGYIAGIIDGEGCIHIDKANDGRGRPHPSYALRVRVAMTDMEVPLFLYEIFGGGFSIFLRDGCKASYNWKATNSRNNNLLRLILPYLKVKKKQAELGLKFIATLRPRGRSKSRGTWKPLPESVIEERRQLQLEISNLNQRGGV